MTTTKVNWLNLTKSDWIWQKEKNKNKKYHNDQNTQLKLTKYRIFGHTHMEIFVVVATVIVFRIFGHIHMIIFVVVAIFRSISKSQFSFLSVFSHVQILRSNSFGHIESIKLTILFKLNKKLVFYLIFRSFFTRLPPELLPVLEPWERWCAIYTWCSPAV